MMKNKPIHFFLLINCWLLFVLTLFVFVVNICLPSGDHMVKALRIYPNDGDWYFHPVLSKFIYQHKTPGNCDLEFLSDENKYYFPQAKLTFLTGILVREYDTKLGWDNNTDIDFLKWSIEAAATNCNPNYTYDYPVLGYYSFPPLLNAVYSRQEDFVKILIDAGADPGLKFDKPDSKFYGRTIFDFACKLRNNNKRDEDNEKLNHIVGLLENADKNHSVCPVGVKNA